MHKTNDPDAPITPTGGKLRQRWNKFRLMMRARSTPKSNPLGPYAVFRDTDPGLWWWCNTHGSRRYPSIASWLPTLPDPNLQTGFIGSAGDTALLEAYRAYRLFLRQAARFGRPIGPQSRVLDFGCGYGRFTRFFMRELPASQLMGADCMPTAVQVSRQCNPWVRFEQINPLPPSSLDANAFDLIYLYSVFSHLSETAHDQWLTEFHRLLKPGGILIATTWPKEYIQWCQDARNGDQRRTHPGSLEAFANTQEHLDRYDRGEFCHSPVGGGKALSTEFYGETCIPHAYAQKRWTDRFEICDFLTQNLPSSQYVIVARRR